MDKKIPTPPEPRREPEEDPERANPDAHEGATDEQVSDRGGPGVGYDQEPEKVKDTGGTAT